MGKPLRPCSFFVVRWFIIILTMKAQITVHMFMSFPSGVGVSYIQKG